MKPSSDSSGEGEKLVPRTVGVEKPAGFSNFDEAHKNSDVDSKQWAKHHTLGWGVNQAAPGELTWQILRAIRPVGEVAMFAKHLPEGWLIPDGSTFSGVDYPELADYLGGTTLPNLANRFMRAGTVAAALTLAGSHSKTLEVANLPAHNHNIRQRWFGTTSTESATTGAIRVTTVGEGDPTGGGGNVAHGPTQNTGSGTAFDIQPAYAVLVVAIRAKAGY